MTHKQNMKQAVARGAFTQNALNNSYYEARVEREGQNVFYEPQPFHPLKLLFTQRITSTQIKTALRAYLCRRDRLPSLRNKHKDCSRKLLRFDSFWCI